MAYIILPGWAYAKNLDPSATWFKQKRPYHKHQRRIHVRVMKKIEDLTHTQQFARTENWEYGSTINHKNMFTPTKTTTDFAKRRRWTRAVDRVSQRYEP